MNEYADEAIGRSTGETFITASVSTVLTVPISAPDTTTHAISATCESIASAITSRTAAKAANTTPSVPTVPSRRLAAGATQTEKIATSRPQPKKTKPSACAPRCSGNGV